MISIIGCSFTATSDTALEINGGNSLPVVSITGCDFAGNVVPPSASRAAGIDLWGAFQSCVVDDCTISGNVGTTGGISVRSTTSVEIRNCLIEGNTGTTRAGGIYTEGSGLLTLTNTILAGNTSSQFGGALYLDGTAAVVTNCTMTGNSSSVAGAGAFIASSSTAFANTISWNDTPGEIFGLAAVDHCLVQGGWNYGGLGNIDADPVFVDPSNGDYHLAATSPCINAGWNAALSLPTTDPDGDPRIVGGLVDIGADEYAFVASPLSGTGDDFAMATYVNGAPTLNGTNSAATGDVLSVVLVSPQGTFVGTPFALAAEVSPTGASLFPGVHVDPNQLVVLFDSSLAAPFGVGAVGLPAGGVTLQYQVIGSLAGSVGRLQGFAVSSPAGNGFFASGDAHDISFL